MSKLPWRKWYPADWLSDEQVGRTTPAARGLWVECLNVMLNTNSYQVQGTPAALARMLRFTVDEFNKALRDLRSTTAAEVDVTICNPPSKQVVTIISRRLKQELNNRERIRLAVSKLRSNKPCNAQVTSASASASASASVSGKGGLGEGVERPSLAEVLERAQMVGLAEWKAKDWYQEMEGCGWLDYNSRPVAKWQPMMDRVRTKWESDGRPMSPPKPRAPNGQELTRPMDLKTVIQAKETKAAEIRAKHCSDTAIDQIWSSPEKRSEYFAIKREVKELNNKLSNLA